MDKDKYHIWIAEMGVLVLTFALVLETYYNINIYSWLMALSFGGWFLIYYFKDLREEEENDKLLLLSYDDK